MSKCPECGQEIYDEECNRLEEVVDDLQTRIKVNEVEYALIRQRIKALQADVKKLLERTE